MQTETTQTYLTVNQGTALACAVGHLVDAIEQMDGRKEWWRLSKARGLLEPIMNPAPAPSCDAPHCDCVEGEDCKANGAAEEVRPAWTIARDRVTGIGDTLKLSDGREVIQYILPERTSYDDMREALHALSDRLHSRKPEKARERPFDVPPDAVTPLAPGMRVETNALYPDLAARLDGLKAAVDALAERLERKAGDGEENLKLRTALADTAIALGGSAIPECSLWFLQQVPREVELVIARLKRERDALAERLERKAGEAKEPRTIKVHDVHVLRVPRGDNIWIVKLDRTIETRTIVRDAGRRLMWVDSVIRHEDEEGVTHLQVHAI